MPTPRLPALAEPERSKALRQRHSQRQNAMLSPGGWGSITEVKHNRKSLQTPFQNSGE